MSNNHNSSNDNFIKSFRYGVKFTERLVKNFGLAFKWVWKKGKSNNFAIKNWCRRNGIDPTVFYFLGTINVAFFALIILPLSLFWAVMRSI